MDRDRESNNAARLAVDVMAAVDPEQLPTAPLDHASKLAASN
jgi:hypothetical protein